MKILNLYCCLGGNRYKWGDNHEITAVELDKDIAKLYKQRFPLDNVIIGDAHEFLLNNYQNFDFIWSSPPCPTNSRARFWGFGANGKNPIYPDLRLYEEIILLKHHFKGKYVVENVIPYYTPLIPGKKRGRHIFWTNFNLPNDLGERKKGCGLIGASNNEVIKLCDFHDYDFHKYKGRQRINKIARNLVDYEVGKTILNLAMGIISDKNKDQLSLKFSA